MTPDNSHFKKIKLNLQPMRYIIKSTTIVIIFFSLYVIVSCKEKHSLPVLTTVSISAVTLTSASSGGVITSDGGEAITARGVCWSIVANPTVSDNKTIDGTGIGSFESILTNLQAGTMYFVRAYATSIAGTSYGNEIAFKTTSTIPSAGNQIIADHTIVADFNKIPKYYIDLIKKMWVVVAGESTHVLIDMVQNYWKNLIRI